MSAYLVTEKVRHLAVWTADDAHAGDVGHRYRPLCGRSAGSALLMRPEEARLPDWLAPVWRERFARARAKRVCKDCTAVAREAWELAAGGPR